MMINFPLLILIYPSQLLFSASLYPPDRRPSVPAAASTGYSRWPAGRSDHLGPVSVSPEDRTSPVPLQCGQPTAGMAPAPRQQRMPPAAACPAEEPAGVLQLPQSSPAPGDPGPGPAGQPAASRSPVPYPH